MMKKLYLLLIAFFCINVIQAQTFEEYVKQRRKEFSQYREKTQKEFDEYRAKLNEDFANFMRKPWEKKDGNAPVPEPIKDIPDVVPVVIPDYVEVDIPDDNEIPLVDIIPLDLDLSKPIPVTPIKYTPKPKEIAVEVSFYGTICKVRFDNNKKVYLKGVSEDDAADMWISMSGEDYNNLLFDCLNIKDQMALCDWGYTQFADSVANKIYQTPNEAAILKAYIMSQSGFKIRLARYNNQSLHTLIAINDDLYNYGYWAIDDKHFYLVDNSDIESLYIFDQEFPNEAAVRMNIVDETRLNTDATSPRSLKSRRYPQASFNVVANRNLINFYKNYPRPYKRDNKYSHWSFYANTPLSEDVKERIYPKLIENIKGKSQQEAANIIINFVQTAFEYKTDDEAWGRERAFFPEETFFYPYSDCEDRAILFTRIVRDLLGLECVLLYYPGHLASAVAFDEDIPGDYVVVNKKRYLVCDPTYINAPIGMTMPDMDNGEAVVILL